MHSDALTTFTVSSMLGYHTQIYSVQPVEQVDEGEAGGAATTETLTPSAQDALRFTKIPAYVSHVSVARLLPLHTSRLSDHSFAPLCLCIAFNARQDSLTRS